MNGKVYLVGAGPGDPELLTLKALRVLRSADAVLHDDLVTREILRMIPASAKVFNVGKRCGKKKISQEEIHFLMSELAGLGMQVVRLKSGDPLIFGRAGEEIEFLRQNEIPFEVVPGVTSALGAAASAAIPLTHRNASSALVFITAHRASGLTQTDWQKFVSSQATLVIYMPGQKYGEIANQLVAAGLASNTACALVSRATTKYERVHRTTVMNLRSAPELPAPTLLLVGEVVGMSDPDGLTRQFLESQLAVDHTRVPLSLLKTFSSAGESFERDQEPIA